MRECSARRCVSTSRTTPSCFQRALLDEKVTHPTADVLGAFGVRADELLKQLIKHREDGKSTSDRIRALLAGRIGQDAIGIGELSRLLHMSPATLRRRLADEGTTYREIVDGLRQELALRYVAEPSVAVGEIAFLLGFSTQSAFGAAFRRWTGMSPWNAVTREVHFARDSLDWREI